MGKQKEQTCRQEDEKKFHSPSSVVIHFRWMKYPYKGFIPANLYTVFQDTGTDRRITERSSEQSTFLENLS